MYTATQARSALVRGNVYIIELPNEVVHETTFLQWTTFEGDLHAEVVITESSDYTVIGKTRLIKWDDVVSVMDAHPKPQEAVSLHIRWLVRKDLSEVLDIEKWAFSYPWSEEDFLRVLSQRNAIGKVACVGESVVGYMIYELHKTHIDLLNMAVYGPCSRQGIGKAMLNKLKGTLSHRHRSKVVMQVSETNVDALKFFASQGFVATGIIPSPYEETDEDAIEMVFRLGW